MAVNGSMQLDRDCGEVYGLSTTSYQHFPHPYKALHPRIFAECAILLWR
jgi:hypothetical protein